MFFQNWKGDNWETLLLRSCKQKAIYLQNVLKRIIHSINTFARHHYICEQTDKSL